MMRLKRIRPNKVIVVVYLTMAGIFKVKAQDNMYNTTRIYYYEVTRSNYGFSIGSGFNFPESFAKMQLAGIYRPSPYFDFSFLRYADDFTFGLSASYNSFKPRISSYPFMFSEDNFGTYHYHNYATFMIYGNAIYNYKLSKRLLVFGGLNLGRYFAKYGLSLANSKISINEPLRDCGFYTAPEIGVGYKLNYYLQVNLQSTYNVFFTSLNTKTVMNLNKAYRYWGNGIVGVFRFR